MSTDGVVQWSWLACSDGFVCLENGVVLDKLPDGQPAQPVQQLVLGPPPASETTHCPGCCELLDLECIDEVLLSPTPDCHKVHHLAHEHPKMYVHIRPPQSAQSARLSWRHILEKCDFGGTFEEIRDERL